MVTRKHILFLAAAAALAVTAVAVVSPQGLGHYRRLANEAERARQQNGALREENARRHAEIEALRSNRRFQEKVVREDLGFVVPGEQLFVVEPAEADPVGSSR
jgi:cell division protein FtsB